MQRSCRESPARVSSPNHPRRKAYWGICRALSHFLRCRLEGVWLKMTPSEIIAEACGLSLPALASVMQILEFEVMDRQLGRNDEQQTILKGF